jgi:hypothetical protein
MRGLRGGLDESGAPPVTSGGEKPGSEGVRAPNGRRYEALGRVMAALAGKAEVPEACRDLAWWRESDHSWHIEWRDGPLASEVAARLAGPGAEPDENGPLAVAAGPTTATTATLDVMGVRFVLRAIDPSGMERLRSRPGLWRLSAALDATVTGVSRSASRQHWEELLGG